MIYVIGLVWAAVMAALFVLVTLLEF